MAAAFAGAVWFPLWMLALGPIVLGVPHLLSDVRYLVARPLLHRRRELVVAVGLPLLATAFRPEAWVGLLAAVGAVACARGSRSCVARRSCPGDVRVCGRVPLADAREPRGVARAQRGGAGAVVDVAAAAIRGARADCGGHRRGRAVLLLGVFTPTLAEPATATPRHPLAWRARAGCRLMLGVRWLMCFAFAQSVHYALWLRLVPDDDRVRRTPRSFRATFEALRGDLGMPVLAITVALALGLALWGAWDLAAARYGYLRFSAFHAYLEVATLALCVAEARAPGEALA